MPYRKKAIVKAKSLWYNKNDNYCCSDGREADMEFFAEFLPEIYMQLMFLVVPKKKGGNKKYRVIATLIAIAVLLGVMALALWGAYSFRNIKIPSASFPSR